MSSRLLLNLGLFIGVVVLVLYIALAPKPAPPAKPKLTALKSETINHIKIQHGTAPDTVLQKKDGHWRLKQPVNMPANTYQVQKLVQLVQTTSQSQFAAKTAKLADMGLDKPIATLMLNDLTLQFGGTDPINQFRYVLLGDKVHLIVDAVSHILIQAPASLGDTALLPEHHNITKLVLPTFTLSKDKDGNWQINGKPSKKLSQDDLVAFIDDWRFAEALRISFVNKLTAKEKTLPKVIFYFENNPTPLTFYLDTSGKNFTLTRTNPGVRYHIIKDKQQTLLNPPKPEEPPAKPSDT